MFPNISSVNEVDFLDFNNLLKSLTAIKSIFFVPYFLIEFIKPCLLKDILYIVCFFNFCLKNNTDECL